MPEHLDSTSQPPHDEEPHDDLPLFVDDDDDHDDPTESSRVPIGLQQPEVLLEDAAEDKPNRKSQKRQRPSAREAALPSTWAFFRTSILTLLAAVLAATVFSYWTPEETLPDTFRAQMQVVRTTDQPFEVFPTPLPTEPPRQVIGIIAGHSGPLRDGTDAVDPGAVCDDNGDGIPELTELEINTVVARGVADKLTAAGYIVEILAEWDPRLDDYRATALVSIHANDCRDYGGGATGYNVAGPSARAIVARGADEALVRCLINEYGAVTGLPRHFGVTEDMTSYHTFREISLDTPTAIIEVGFMFADRAFLTQNQDSIAEGVAQGILCFLEQ
jgi:N-acetylmuramoyl-L-alanine amidase